jgi:rubrerythrin
MGNKYAGTKTEKNLMDAFSGESQARNKYTYFASVAQKEGYEQIAALFLKTARNEQEHARLWFESWATWANPRITSFTPPKAKTMSGPICMSGSPKTRKKKVSPRWPGGSAG